MDDSQSQDKACWTREMLHAFCDICIKAIEQGVGWSAELGTISAPDEWWKAKSQEIRGARKFRHARIDPTLCCKYDIMFTNTIATGQYAWAPSQGLNADEDGVSERQTNAVNEDPHIEEGSGDSEEDNLPNFVADVNNMVAGVTFANSTSNPTSSSGKRKDKLVDSVSSKSECTSSVFDKKGCSIEEVMTEFHSIEEVVFGSELYCFATEFFMVRSRREMWAAIGDLDRKIQWLKLMFDRRASYRP
ncbi:hypothetical protein Peur_058818 [Populus x canadensis]